MFPKLEYILLAFGVWIMALPFLGFPRSIKNILFIATGILLIILAYLLYQKKKDRMRKKAIMLTEVTN